MKTIRTIIMIVVAGMGSFLANANNLVVTNAERLNAGGARDEVAFTISWENSWNVSGAPANHDAAWVFIKFRECGDFGEWHHAKLATTSGASGTNSASGHTLGADLVFATDILVTDRRGKTYNGEHNTGAMLRRATIGIGNIAAQVCTLKVLGTATNGTAFDPALEYDIKVFGIEMVQIPEGPFYLGDGASYDRYHKTGLPSEPVHINAGEETAYTFENDGYGAANRTYADSVSIGYGEFYCMKYEISQGQYVDFLNTLNSSQQNSRFYAHNTYGMHCTRVGNVASTNYPNRASGYQSHYDYLSYLDWACLRPMNDVEFEKICRGPGYPKSEERIWGSDPGLGDFVDAEDVNYPAEGQMTCDIVNANVNSLEGTNVVDYPGPSNYGVMDVGIFARDGSETRVSSGASYYGVMDMAGNVLECCISLCYRSTMCVGIWGDGDLEDGNGQFNTPEWIAIASAGNDYVVAKGGYWNMYDQYSRFTISGRYDDGWEWWNSVSYDRTIRGLR